MHARRSTARNSPAQVLLDGESQHVPHQIVTPLLPHVPDTIKLRTCCVARWIRRHLHLAHRSGVHDPLSLNGAPYSTLDQRETASNFTHDYVV
jgi:hypothetical protein